MKAYKHRSPTRLVMATAHIPFKKYRLKCVDPVQTQTNLITMKHYNMYDRRLFVTTNVPINRVRHDLS